MSQSFLYFLAAVFLAGGFVVSVLIYFLPGRIVAPSSLQELVPAGCVFLGFGLLQTLRAFIAHRNQAQEFRLLVARHGHTMQTAEFLLMDHEPKSQADE